MTLFAYALVIVCASFAEASASDAVTLLQAQVLEKIAKLPANDILLEPGGDFLLAETLKCASEQPTAITSIPGEPFPVMVEAPSAGISAVEGSSGATLFKLLLGLMVVLLIVDGLRRCRSQKEDGDKRKDDGKESSRDAWAVMISAAKSGDLDSFQTALNSSEACVMQTDNWGCTPLHFAAVGGSADIALSLLRKCADADALDAFDETPLHFAARADHASICEVLLDAGAAIDALNTKGMTPLVVAGRENSKTACTILAERGAAVAGLPDEELPLPLVIELIEKTFSTGQ